MATTEKWQVNLGGRILETDLDTLRSWISEGRVRAEDHVKKGNLNWIPAGRVPSLRALFQVAVKPPEDGRAIGNERPLRTEETLKCPAPTDEEQATVGIRDGTDSGSSTCRRHPHSQAEYICRVCRAPFCNECPEFVGSSRIPTCPLCGDLCLPLSDRPGVEALPLPAAPHESQFGWGSLGKAMRYPFKFPAALIIAAGIYGFLQLGSVIGMRSRLMVVMLANGLLFGCLSQVVKQVAWGRFGASFLGGFDSFSIWDNAIRPTLIGFGVLLVTFGPFIFLLVALMSGWLGNVSDVAQTHAHLENEAQQQVLTADELKALINSENPDKDAEVMKKINRLRPANQAQEMVKEKTPPSPQEKLLPLAGRFLKAAPGWVLGALLLALLWAVVYYPMALAVAGYSDDFGSLLNPLVGLDTMRRMGSVYLRVFVMYLIVQGVGFALVLLLSDVTRSLTLPFLGNLPGLILKGVVTFYSSLAVAFLLGLSLHERAAELNIPTD